MTAALPTPACPEEIPPSGSLLSLFCGAGGIDLGFAQVGYNTAIALEPDLKADIDAYAALYESSYGNAVAPNALVPVMLQAFLASDVGFRRARKAMADG